MTCRVAEGPAALASFWDWSRGMSESLSPWIIKIGQETLAILERLSNLCLTRTWPRYPAIFLATHLMDVNGLISIRQPNLYRELTWTAGPEPIDLPRLSLPSTYNDDVLFFERESIHSKSDYAFYVLIDVFLSRLPPRIHAVSRIFHPEYIVLESEDRLH